VHVPRRKKAQGHPVFAFDGVTIWNQQGNMGRINGLSDASEKYGFTAIYPVPMTRYCGIIAGWNTPGGYLNFRSGYDDVAFVCAIFAMLKLERAYALGFSAGAQFAHVLAGRLAGSFLGVGSIAGTWLGTEPLPPAGTALMVVHGEEDPVQPYRGVRRGLRVRALVLLGNRNVLLSRPDLQARVYAAANGYRAEPTVEKTDLYTDLWEWRGAGCGISDAASV
jgi:poly(3-hydroxybutyrate) depolymerase